MEYIMEKIWHNTIHIYDDWLNRMALHDSRI